MIQFELENRIIREALQSRVKSLDKPLDIDTHLAEFDDVRYRIQATADDPQHVKISIRLPAAHPDVGAVDGLPPGTPEALIEAYGDAVVAVTPPETGFYLTVQLDLTKMPPAQADADKLLSKLACLRAVVMGAQLRKMLAALLGGGSATAPPVALMHRSGEAFYATPQGEKVTVIFPMRFVDANDAVLATSFLQEFMEARRTGGTGSLSSAPPCSHSPTPPLELKDVPNVQEANAGFVSFVIFQRHVEGGKLDRTVWALLTFYSYVSYHVKCSKAFMHTRMRRRVNSLIQVLNRAKPDQEKEKKTAQGRTFVRKDKV